jgi:type III secretion protein J
VRSAKLGHHIAGCLVLLGLGCDAELYHGLPERQANQAVVALREAGFAADKRPEGRGGRPGSAFTLVVPRREEVAALKLLAERGLPRLPREPGRGGLLPLPAEQRAEQAAHLGEQLAATLEALPEVLQAQVHLALPDEDPLRPGERQRATASVLLRLRGGAAAPEAGVRRLLSGAVPGLDPEDVVVVAAAAPSGPPSGPALVRVGPLWVAPGSFRWAAVLISANLLLGAVVVGLLYLVLRRRRAAA